MTYRKDKGRRAIAVAEFSQAKEKLLKKKNTIFGEERGNETH